MSGMKRKLDSDDVLDDARGRKRRLQLNGQPLNEDVSIRAHGSQTEEDEVSSISSSTFSSLSSDSNKEPSSSHSFDSESTQEESEESSSGTGSEDSDEREDDSDEPINLTFQRPPNITPIAANSDLQSRLSEFIPALAAANASLQEEPSEDRLLDQMTERGEGDDGPYIEMDLGLGVLEERSRDIIFSETSPSSSGVAEDGDDTPKSTKDVAADVMTTLLGKKAARADIEEVGGD